MIAYGPTCCLQKIGGPDLAVRESVAGQRLRADFDVVARFVRSYVSSVADNYATEKVFVQMVDLVNHAVMHRGGDAQIVEHREMLHVLAKTYSASVRTHGNLEFGSK